MAEKPLTITFINRLMGIVRGGGENVDLRFAEVLAGLGCEVKFMAGRRWRTLDQAVSGFATAYIATPYLRGLQYRWGDNRHYPIRKLVSLAARIDLLLFSREVIKQIEADGGDGTDIYQICGIPFLGARIKAMTGRPVIIRWPGPPPLKWRQWYPDCTGHIANGDALLQARRVIGPKVREIKVGVDAERFSPTFRSTFWTPYGVPEGALVILFVGRLRSIKNIPLLLAGFGEACRAQEQLYLALVGEGEEEAALKSRVIKSGLQERVLFPGRLEGRALAAAYASADIFALASRYDNFPNVVLEAMASGLPIVATRVGGIPMQVEDGINGFLIDSGDAKGLSRAILRLAGDPERRRRIGMANREVALEAYNWQKSGIKLLSFYREMLAAPQ